MDDINSLSHSKWRCKYHIVFAPKYRRKVIYGKVKADIRTPPVTKIKDFERAPGNLETSL